DGTATPREAFDRLLGELRPKLHRYCARMTGSVIDGEDVVQEALVKAIEAYAAAGPIANPAGWLFRIAHNAALDLLRRRARREATHADEDMEMIIDPISVADERQAAAAGLRTFMHLPVAQRSSVILMDVLGHTTQEVAGIIDSSIPAVKAALHRGRARLRELANEPDSDPRPVLAAAEQLRLAAYVDRFNARDFDAVRDMLAEEVRLELVNRLRLSGRKEVGNYFHRYGEVRDWRFVAGLVDRRPAILVCDPDDPAGTPKYFVLLEWRGNAVVGIRDFLFARYAIDGAELHMVR
ncbi:MAG: polymerase subunit sigma-70, partial [Rhodospirillales bacterium]|nr:polymerase subunit sigma-70 [Rhodospirillales bacterium]